MSKILRILTAAAVLGFGLPQMANAVPVTKTIDFEGIASGTDMTGAGNPYNDDAHGFTTFSGNAFSKATKDFEDNDTTALWSKCPDSGCAQSTLTITIAQLFHGDGAGRGLTLDLGNGDNLRLEIKDENGNVLKLVSDFEPHEVGLREDPIFIAFTGVAKSIVFTGLSQAFIIDNLSFSVDARTTTPGVPEPSSVALVALALAGAAAVRRRKA